MMICRYVYTQHITPSPFLCTHSRTCGTTGRDTMPVFLWVPPPSPGGESRGIINQITPTPLSKMANMISDAANDLYKELLRIGVDTARTMEHNYIELMANCERLTARLLTTTKI